MLNEYDVHDVYDALCEVLRIETPPLLEVKKSWSHASGVAWDRDGCSPRIIVNFEMVELLQRPDLAQLLTVELARAARGPARDARFHALCHLFFQRLGLRYTDRAAVEYHPTHYSWLAALTRGRLVARLQAASAAMAAQIHGVITLNDKNAVELVNTLPHVRGEWITRLAEPDFLSNFVASIGLGLIVLAIPLVQTSHWLSLGLVVAGVVVLVTEQAARKFWTRRCLRGGPRVIAY